MPQQPRIGDDVTALMSGSEPAVGADVTALMREPDFKTTAEVPSWLDLGLEAVKGAVQQINPLPMLKQLYDEQQGQATKAMQEGGIRGALRAELKTGPVAAGAQVVGGLALAQWDQVKKAKAAYDAGDYSAALGHTAAAVLPVIGPAAAGVGEQAAAALESGDTRQLARAAGGAAGIVAPFGAASAMRRMGGVRVPGLANPNPVEAALVEFGQARDIPIDAGMATGSQFVRGVQKMAESTPLGAIVEKGVEGRRAAALTATGQELAARAAPEFATAETAGAGTTSAVEKLIQDLHEQANTAYDKLRTIEANRIESVSAPVASDAVRQANMAKTIGHVPRPTELAEMRRMQAELEAVPYQKSSYGAAPGEDEGYTPRSGNAPVYHDILQAAPGTSQITGVEMARSIGKAIQTGHFDNPAVGALEVARARLKNSPSVSSPILPPSAGQMMPTESMAFPVDLRAVKNAMEPTYTRLKREAELVPLVGGKAQALTTLDRIMRGPDFAPLSVADGALSDLKAMARGADMPELRSVAQGTAAYAVKNLDAAVRQAATEAGPEAIQALEEGRSATVAKYAAKDVLDTLREEPVQAYRQAIAPKDTQIGFLRQLQEMAPGEVPKIGRAWIEDALQKSTGRGGFKRGAGVLQDWERLGPETKRILFGPDLTSDLGKFFLLAERLGEQANPSRTALTLMAGHSVGQAATLGTSLALMNAPVFFAALGEILGTGGLAKFLHSKVGVKLLTKGLTLPASKVARAPVVAQILKLAADDGIVLPQAAGDEQSPPAGAAQR